VSYWLRTDPEVDVRHPNEIVAVCPHHDGQFNVLLADSSVQQTSWSRLMQYFMVITKPIQLQRRPWQQ
jgi:prepilin-type processing-associated H-X9-DG protein